MHEIPPAIPEETEREQIRAQFRALLVTLGTTTLNERTGLSPQTLANIASGVRVHRRTWQLAREYLTRRNAHQPTTQQVA